jgi:hypothetical protein
MINHQPIHRGIARQILLAEQDVEKLRITHRGEGVSREHTGNVLQQGAEGRRGGGGERGARPGRGAERRRLVLGGDGGQHGRLAPADGAAAELDAHGDVGERGEARGRDGEGRGERDAERARAGRRHVHGEGLLECVEAERAHGGGRGRGRRDGAEAGGGGGGRGLVAAGRDDEAGRPRGRGGARAGSGGEPERRRGDRRVHGAHCVRGKRRPEAGRRDSRGSGERRRASENATGRERERGETPSGALVFYSVAHHIAYRHIIVRTAVGRDKAPHQAGKGQLARSTHVGARLSSPVRCCAPGRCRRGRGGRRHRRSAEAGDQHVGLVRLDVAVVQRFQIPRR